MLILKTCLIITTKSCCYPNITFKSITFTIKDVALLRNIIQIFIQLPIKQKIVLFKIKIYKKYLIIKPLMVPIYEKLKKKLIYYYEITNVNITSANYWKQIIRIIIFCLTVLLKIIYVI